MQPNDERPPASGRPSLHSIDQRVDSDLLATRSYPKNGFGKISLAITCSVLLAIVGGSILWTGQAHEKQIILAGTEPIVAESSALPDPELSEGEPVELVTVSEPPPVPVAAAAPARVKAVKAVKVRATARPRPVKAGKARPAAARPRKIAAKKPAVKKAATVAPAVALAAAPTAVENDVALLSALVTHAKTTQPTAFSFETSYRQCRALKPLNQMQRCIARLCAGKARAECR